MAAVMCDDDGFHSAQGDLRWSDLVRVEIVVTDEGPFVEDVFWLLASAERTLLIPQGDDGADALLERLQRLPGFDDKAVVLAMSCTRAERFLCWRRP